MVKLSQTILALVILASLINGCGSSHDTTSYGDETVIDSNEPAFPSLSANWIVDLTGVLDARTVIHVNEVCEKLNSSGLAEVVVLVANGIHNPEKYATNYGRYNKLGRTGPSTQGGNNGIVWLIRPDAKTKKMTISVGRGLPKFTSADYGQIIDKNQDYANFNNFDACVLHVVKDTSDKLRQIYGGVEK